MQRILNYFCLCSLFYLFSCGGKDVDAPELRKPKVTDSAYNAEHITKIETGYTRPEDLVRFAYTQEGVPYKFGSKDPEQGFDCSGFITYVFNHFQIAVPRMSIDFTPVQHEVGLANAKPGDLILFTGTDSTVRIVGHMGIITSFPGEDIKFIHSTSGKARGVVETPLNHYYEARYVKTIRVFPQNDASYP
ncbi:MAG TPA: NlpC/P60 family protein [Mucilaginibacter sp.]|nr:NlpC/P60 family protein [Mucilaginibacter sp.]